MEHTIFMITTITGKNQVTVPARLAARADLHPGTRLDWELAESGDTLIAHVLPDVATLASRLRGAGRKHLRGGGSAVRNLIRERAREDAERR
jgi:bifunctional DNA-binding transcriptional regulator/antitoxin component of YhaV-PrlF toxin-antitoxin module